MSSKPSKHLFSKSYTASQRTKRRDPLDVLISKREYSTSQRTVERINKIAYRTLCVATGALYFLLLCILYSELNYFDRRYGDEISESIDILLNDPIDEILIELEKRMYHVRKYNEYYEWDGVVGHDSVEIRNVSIKVAARIITKAIENKSELSLVEKAKALEIILSYYPIPFRSTLNFLDQLYLAGHKEEFVKIKQMLVLNQHSNEGVSEKEVYDCLEQKITGAS